MPNSDISYYGIRHHGPGSSRRLIASLEKQSPSMVLIEGPADCSELLPMLADPKMKPPIALLAYAADDPACSMYYPFADFSPEYQTACWARANDIPLAFIDLPINIQLAQMLLARKITEPSQEEGSEKDMDIEDRPETNQPYSEIVRDPIGILAKYAGYEDGEAWWNDLIEQSKNDSEDHLQIFSTVELAMAELRSQIHEHDTQELQREAYMRLEIAKATKAYDGPIAVVCGAWHVPALKENHAQKNDRLLLKELPTKLAKSKVKCTWVPWTSPRLANVSGYGAGVDAPMWYQHLWNERNNTYSLESWLTHVARVLRNNGQIISTASVIEATRLSTSLAILRNRPAPGFEEIREAVIACLCFGEKLIWKEAEEKILLGNLVGEVPESIPLVPLLEDLQRLQKKTKLKPEALEKDLSLDLRSESGQAKSILLHRLSILEVPWGNLTDSGKSRGTFRERWILSWRPEYAIQLVENLVYGSTIEQAANNRIGESLQGETNLCKLAETVHLCLESQLDEAAEIGLARLQDRAAHTSDAIELLESIEPLVNINRYGTARQLSIEHIHELVNRLTVQAALTLPYASRNLNHEEALYYRKSISKAHQAVLLAELDDSITEEWWQALHNIVENLQTSLQIAGLCTRLLYQAQRFAPEKLELILQKMLSPAIPAADAANFFEGFFAESVQRLLYDSILLRTVENWILSLDEEIFIEFLPLFRRVFSGLDPMERKRMMDTILNGQTQIRLNKEFNPITSSRWPEHLTRIGKLMHRNKNWAQ